MTKGSIVRSYLQGSDILVAPGVFNGFTAKIAEQAGFGAVYITGFGAAANLLGAPDIGLVSFSEMLRHVSYITEAVGVPVIADADTGYGNAVNVRRTVREYESSRFVVPRNFSNLSWEDEPVKVTLSLEPEVIASDENNNNITDL